MKKDKVGFNFTIFINSCHEVEVNYPPTTAYTKKMIHLYSSPSCSSPWQNGLPVVSLHRALHLRGQPPLLPIVSLHHALHSTDNLH
jgi:hypothetical protein